MEKPIEIAVVSGKGGTGKTVLASSLARLTTSKVLADCDVDTPNMHLLLNPRIRSEESVSAYRIAVIRRDACTRCGECFRICRFAAVKEKDVPEGWEYSIDSLACEGCGACSLACPADAVDMIETPTGTWYISDSDFGTLVHASLGPGKKGSGELVKIVRREAMRAAAREGFRYVIIDGPAGIGAPAIAAVLGISLALVVTEPTLSGMFDLRRVITLLKQLDIRTAAVINKHDVNVPIALEIEAYLSSSDVPLLGTIPFSREVNRAIVDRRFIVDVAADPAAREIKEVANNILALVGD